MSKLTYSYMLELIPREKLIFRCNLYVFSTHRGGKMSRGCRIMIYCYDAVPSRWLLLLKSQVYYKSQAHVSQCGSLNMLFHRSFVLIS